MADNVQFLAVIQHILADADDAKETLQKAIDNPKNPPGVRIKMVKIQSVLEMQSMLIRKFTEEHMEFGDHLDALAKKHLPDYQ